MAKHFWNKTPSACSNKRTRRYSTWRRFKKSDDGTAAIEFAVLAIPFLIICFGILETSFSYFAHRTLDASVNTIARKIRLGIINNSSYTGDPTAAFKNELCGLSTMMLFDCGKLVVDVKTIQNFEPPKNPEYDENGNLKVENFSFQPGGGGTINIVSVYYDWPDIVNWSAFGFDKGQGKKHLMRSVTAFMNESFN